MGGCEKRHGHPVSASVLADSKEARAKPSVAIPESVIPYWNSLLRLFYRGQLGFLWIRGHKL